MKHLGWMVIAGALCAGPASADWQFTKWGMSKDQVIKASRGKASDADVADLEAHNLANKSATAQLKMPYTTGPLSFTAYFLFSLDGQLVTVELDAVGGANAQAAFDAVGGKYGMPDRSHWSTVLSSATSIPNATSRSWETGRTWYTKYDEIRAEINGAPDQLPTKVSITYIARRHKGDEGL